MNKQHSIFKHNQFYNKDPDPVHITLKEIIIHYIKNIINKNSFFSLENKQALSFDLLLKKLYSEYNKLKKDDILIIPLGHASLLIHFQNMTLLIDPIFNSSSIFLKRYINNIIIDALPSIDIVIYSHNHPDHYNSNDLAMIMQHSPAVKIIGPTGYKEFLKNEGFNNEENIISLNWWEETSYNNITVTALPAIHWSQSNFYDKNKILWASWMISLDNKNIYFAGDTAYSDHFKSIKYYMKKIDIACLPIAPYLPEEIQIDSHMNVEQSYQAFLDLDMPLFIPIHWGVFAYGDEPLKEPIEKIITLFHTHNHLEKLQSTTINCPYVFSK